MLLPKTEALFWLRYSIPREDEPFCFLLETWSKQIYSGWIEISSILFCSYYPSYAFCRLLTFFIFFFTSNSSFSRKISGLHCRLSNGLDPYQARRIVGPHLTFCWAWSGSKLFAKVISRRRNISYSKIIIIDLTFCRVWSGSKLFAKVISRRRHISYSKIIIIDLTFCRVWSGSKLFANVISRRRNICITILIVAKLRPPARWLRWLFDGSFCMYAISIVDSKIDENCLKQKYDLIHVIIDLSLTTSNCSNTLTVIYLFQ